jgi:citronellol/citronellal dehydrogenase
VREESQVQDAVDQTVETFGGIDILVNNASAIFLAKTEATPMKRFDLMHEVNARASFLCAQKCLPHLKRSSRAHILTLSPPLDLRPAYFGPHVAYSMSKFGMSLCTLGLAEELRPLGIAVNSLWPQTIIDTSAVRNLLGGQQVASRGRTPAIVADAAHVVLTRETSFTGNFLIDEDLLRSEGQTDFAKYAAEEGAELLPDLFVAESLA